MFLKNYCIIIVSKRGRNMLNEISLFLVVSVESFLLKLYTNQNYDLYLKLKYEIHNHPFFMFIIIAIILLQVYFLLKMIISYLLIEQPIVIRIGYKSYYLLIFKKFISFIITMIVSNALIDYIIFKQINFIDILINNILLIITIPLFLIKKINTYAFVIVTFFILISRFIIF